MIFGLIITLLGIAMAVMAGFALYTLRHGIIQTFPCAAKQQCPTGFPQMYFGLATDNLTVIPVTKAKALKFYLYDQNMAIFSSDKKTIMMQVGTQVQMIPVNSINNVDTSSQKSTLATASIDPNCVRVNVADSILVVGADWTIPSAEVFFSNTSVSTGAVLGATANSVIAWL